MSNNLEYMRVWRAAHKEWVHESRVLGNLKSKFGGNRELAIQRDGEKCVSCGMTRSEHKEKYGRDITVDHIDGRGTYTPIKERNHELSNLQTLCASCHGRKDSLRGWRGRRQHA